MADTPNIGENPVQPVQYTEPTISTEKMFTLDGMCALIEDHADYWGGAGRLTQLLDCCTDARTWNALHLMLSLDLCDGAH